MSQKLSVGQQVHFLGNRTDMVELYETADVFVTASRREGLSRALMEAMAMELPCIASRIRGNVDLLVNGEGGYLCDSGNAMGFSNRINELAGRKSMREMGAVNVQTTWKFDTASVSKGIAKIYRETLEKRRLPS